MTLIIQKSDEITETFIHWLENEIKTRLIVYSNSKQLDRLSMFTKDILNVQLNLNSMYLNIVDSIKFKETATSFVLTFEYIGINNLDMIIKYINFGSAEVNGYPIFSKIFNDVTNNLDLYISKYKLVGVL